MNIPAALKYTREHEWVKVDGNKVTVGITDFAQHALGDVVFVDLPVVGANAVTGEAFAAVESVKAVSDIYSPVNGKIVEVNENLTDAPETVNQDPYGEAWMIVIELADSKALDELMDAAQYSAFIEAEGEE